MTNSAWHRLVFLGLSVAAALPARATEPLPSNRDIHIQVANDAGARYGAGVDDTYWLNAPGGGLNQLHISTTAAAGAVSGQVTTQTTASSSASGSFWVTTTGGRGYNDDLVLAFSVTGPLRDDFSLRVRSSGYQWDAGATLPSSLTYVDGALDETFVSSDFLYGPQTAKPGPGTGWTLPFWSGQDIADPGTRQVLMFIDLNVGNIADRTAVDSGSAGVQFEITGLYDARASFNAYAFAMAANVADASINWTNRVSTNASEAGQSGYSVLSIAQPVPEPASAALMLVGAAFLIGYRRRRRATA